MFAASCWLFTARKRLKAGREVRESIPDKGRGHHCSKPQSLPRTFLLHVTKSLKLLGESILKPTQVKACYDWE
jgi:hypothetical protein